LDRPACAQGDRSDRPSKLEEKRWDPITRIVGSLGIFTRPRAGPDHVLAAV
jgi:hypothetical protein